MLLVPAAVGQGTLAAAPAAADAAAAAAMVAGADSCLLWDLLASAAVDQTAGALALQPAAIDAVLGHLCHHEAGRVCPHRLMMQASSCQMRPLRPMKQLSKSELRCLQTAWAHWLNKHALEPAGPAPPTAAAGGAAVAGMVAGACHLAWRRRWCLTAWACLLAGLLAAQHAHLICRAALSGV